MKHAQHRQQGPLRGTPRLPAQAIVRAVSMAAALALLAGCANRLPRHEPGEPARTRAQPDLPATLPVASTGSSGTLAQDVAPLDWRAFVRDAELAQFVERALASNRDLRAAGFAVERAQAQLALSESARAPQVGVGVGAQRAPNALGDQSNLFTAGVQLAAWELDLFGRLRANDDAARAQWLASRAGQRASETALVAQVLATALAVRADQRLLALAERTLAGRTETLRLVELRERAGYTSRIELESQLALVAQARALLAQATRQEAEDTALLQRLVGGPVAPQRVAALDPNALAVVEPGISSQVLWERPDVMQAEQELEAASASVRAARATLWPSITLTAQAGQAAAALSGLFNAGHFVYTLAANVAYAIFDGGRRKAGIEVASAGERLALARYEAALQSAFRETAAALAGTSTWRAQREAADAQARAAREVARLVNLKVEHGAASLLEQLEAERSLLAAEQQQVALALAELNNRIALFKALGR